MSTFNTVRTIRTLESVFCLPTVSVTIDGAK